MQQPLNKNSKPTSTRQTVRIIYLLISVTLIVLFPLLKEEAVIPFVIGTSLVIALIILSALIGSNKRWVLYTSAIVSLLGILLFETLAFTTPIANTAVFVVRQVIALGFLFSLYLSVQIIVKLKGQINSPVSSDENLAAEPGESKSNEELLQKLKQD